MSFERARILVLITSLTLGASSMWAQDLGPHFRKIKEGIYVQSAREVAIPEMLTTIKMLKSLNPEVVVPGHGSFGTMKIFDDSERYYGLLLERVSAMARAGNSLDQIKQELRMPEYKDWSYQERMPTNIEAAYRAVKGVKAP